MGTNYYWHQKQEDSCPTCGHAPAHEPVHIGKSSFGWVFALHVYPAGIDGDRTARIHDLDDWRHIWRDREGTIVDEYGEEVSWQRLESIIVERSAYGEAEAEPLNRGDLGAHCIAHGPGSWDLHIGDFC